jgi:selenocysteine lyase/cysteine desulfurase
VPSLAIPRPAPAVSIEDTLCIPPVVGNRLRVPLVTGGQVGYANLDHAASAPCLQAVQDAVNELLPWYASVHRGAGFASQVCTRVYENARATLLGFVGARRTDSVIFTRNTTDALNLLAKALPRSTSVVVFDTEHHAALLPWSGRIHRITAPASPADAVAALDAALAECREGPRLAVLTGASNVTGEVWPIAELVKVARRRGARTVLDAAQLVAHRPVRISELDVDYVALSGHKLYAPFGAGALIGRGDWLNAGDPYLAGGGASRAVRESGTVAWNTGPERHEAGSPNTVGVHALATACATLERNGWGSIIEHEEALLRRLRDGLRAVPGLRELNLFGSRHDRVGVVSFTIDGHDPGLLAAALSAEHGIGVRDGLFCAHLAVRHLLRTAEADSPRAVRVSIGLGTTFEHVERFIAGLHRLVADGPAWDYEQRDGRWAPVDDPREAPDFLGLG